MLEVAFRYREAMRDFLNYLDVSKSVEFSAFLHEPESSQAYQNALALANELNHWRDICEFRFNPASFAKANHSEMPGSDRPISDFDWKKIEARFAELQREPGFQEAIRHLDPEYDPDQEVRERRFAALFFAIWTHSGGVVYDRMAPGNITPSPSAAPASPTAAPPANSATPPTSASSAASPAHGNSVAASSAPPSPALDAPARSAGSSSSPSPPSSSAPTSSAAAAKASMSPSPTPPTSPASLPTPKTSSSPASKSPSHPPSSTPPRTVPQTRAKKGSNKP
jgi:hypothetical protein